MLPLYLNPVLSFALFYVYSLRSFLRSSHSSGKTLGCYHTHISYRILDWDLKHPWPGSTYQCHRVFVYSIVILSDQIICNRANYIHPLHLTWIALKTQ